MHPTKCPRCGNEEITAAEIEVRAVCAGIYDKTGRTTDDLIPPEIVFTLEGWECPECEYHGCDQEEVKRRIEQRANKSLRPQLEEKDRKCRDEMRRRAELN